MVIANRPRLLEVQRLLFPYSYVWFVDPLKRCLNLVPEIYNEEQHHSHYSLR